MQNKPLTNTIPDRDELKLPIIRHKFEQFFFHPTKPDLIVCLENNQFPEKVNEFKLVSVDKVHQNTSKEADVSFEQMKGD